MIMKSYAERVYRVEFNTYINYLKTAVRDCSGKTYLEIPLGGLLVKESKLEYYKKYGDGFKSIILVGSVYNEDV